MTGEYAKSWVAGTLRIGDAERDQAATALGEHLRAGRLGVAEYDDRLQAAFQARTAADLTPLFSDLPGGSPLGPFAVTVNNARQLRGSVRAALWRVTVGALIAVAVVTSLGWALVTEHPPVFLFPLVAFLLVRRGLRGRCGGRQGSRRQTAHSPSRRDWR